MNGRQLARFMAKVDQTNSCWLWMASVKPNGYGQFGLDEERRSAYAHRLAYEHFIGSVPPGRELHHICGVRHCVNPEHLRLVTHHENCLHGEGLAARNARKTHCPRGHPYEEHNSPQKDGSRKCRICHRDRERLRRKRRRVASSS